MPGEPKRRLGAVARPHDVQAAIEPRGDTCRSDDVALVDIEHVGVDGDVRMERPQLVRIGPVGRCLPAGKQADGGDGEGAEAQADDQGAAPMRARQRLRERLR